MGIEQPHAGTTMTHIGIKFHLADPARPDIASERAATLCEQENQAASAISGASKS